MSHHSTAVYHIAERDAWHNLPSGDDYLPAAFEADGFVHCSTWTQLPRVAESFFADRTDLVVLKVDVNALQAEVRWEDLYNAGEPFPHVYGPITRTAVVTTFAVTWPVPGRAAFALIGAPVTTARGSAGTQLITGETTEADEFIHTNLKSFNDRHSPHHLQARASGRKQLAVMLCDATGTWVGGISGAVIWDWLEIQDLWIDKRYRNAGWGRGLLLEIERQATELGARRSQLSTFHFQARGFYEKLGYRVIGELTDFPPGGAMYWMRKDNALGTE